MKTNEDLKQLGKEVKELVKDGKWAIYTVDDPNITYILHCPAVPKCCGPYAEKVYELDISGKPLRTRDSLDGLKIIDVINVG